MNILILGAAGFIGTNLTLKLAKNEQNIITVVDKKIEYFDTIKCFNLPNISYKVSSFDDNVDFDDLLYNQDIVYHLVSSNVPSNSNKQITLDIQYNVIFSSNLFDACVRNNIKKVIFISSGGTVYGIESNCPLNEETPTYPITSYGIQKITIEKLLYLYNYMYNLDYRIIRLANPYGPYQRPNGVLGAVTTFTYKALKKEKIIVYGDGSVVRDYIYIDDAIRGLLKVVDADSKYKTFNLGSGIGTSINQLLKIIEKTLKIKLNIEYREGRSVDVPINYLDIRRIESTIGKLNPIGLEEGIEKTAEFIKRNY